MLMEIGAAGASVVARAVLAERDRQRGGVTAPPDGLYSSARSIRRNALPAFDPNESLPW